MQDAVSGVQFKHGKRPCHFQQFLIEDLMALHLIASIDNDRHAKSSFYTNSIMPELGQIVMEQAVGTKYWAKPWKKILICLASLKQHRVTIACYIYME